MLEGQTPADFHTGCETGAESWNCQSGETDEGCHIRDFDGPQTKALFPKMLLDAVRQRVALDATEATGEVFHNSPIGIHCGKGFPILVTPSTQADATAGQCHESAHRYAILCLKRGKGEPASGRWPL
jgi:hypothetical protein